MNLNILASLIFISSTFLCLTVLFILINRRLYRKKLASVSTESTLEEGYQNFVTSKDENVFDKIEK